MSELSFVLANGESPSTFLPNAKNVDPFPNPPRDVMAELAPTTDTCVLCDVSIQAAITAWGSKLVGHVKQYIHSCDHGI